MTRHFLMYFAFALSSSLTQCSKTTVDPNGLPPETQTGAGTFACKINGMVWKYKDPDYQFLDTRPRTKWSFDSNDKSGTLQITALRYQDPSSSIYNEIIDFYADSLLLLKEKIMNSYGYNYGFVYTNSYPAGKECSDYNSTGVNDKSGKFSSSGKLTITKLDQNLKIISGNFFCNIFQTGCGDTFRITEGRFDLKYQ